MLVLNDAITTPFDPMARYFPTALGLAPAVRFVIDNPFGKLSWVTIRLLALPFKDAALKFVNPPPLPLYWPLFKVKPEELKTMLIFVGLLAVDIPHACVEFVVGPVP